MPNVTITVEELRSRSLRKLHGLAGADEVSKITWEIAEALLPPDQRSLGDSTNRDIVKTELEKALSVMKDAPVEEIVAAMQRVNHIFETHHSALSARINMTGSNPLHLDGLVANGIVAAVGELYTALAKDLVKNCPGYEQAAKVAGLPAGRNLS